MALKSSGSGPSLRAVEPRGSRGSFTEAIARGTSSDRVEEMDPPVLSIEFIDCWFSLPAEIQIHIIECLLTGLQPPPEKAEEEFLYDAGELHRVHGLRAACRIHSLRVAMTVTLDSTDPGPHPPSLDQAIELVRSLSAFQHLAVLGDSAAVPLAKPRALWSSARTKQATELTRLNRERRNFQLQNLLCEHIRQCDDLIAHAQWMIGDPAGKEYHGWDAKLAMLLSAERAAARAAKKIRKRAATHAAKKVRKNERKARKAAEEKENQARNKARSDRKKLRRRKT